MSKLLYHIEDGSVADLDAVNRVIEAAVMGWAIPERVKRLSLPLYRYDPIDLDHLRLLVARHDDGIIGVATWEPADPADAPDGKAAILLHGLYVHPDWQRRGVGRCLLDAVCAAIPVVDGVLVKAQADAREFFAAAGFEALPVDDDARDYAHRFWLPLS